MGLNIFAPDRSEPRIVTLDAPVMLCRIRTPRALPGEGLEYLVKKW